MEIAIINPDTLSAIGLKKLLSEISEEFIIRTFADYGTFADDTPDMYTWYFVSSQTYVLYNSFFLPAEAFPCFIPFSFRQAHKR